MIEVERDSSGKEVLFGALFSILPGIGVYILTDSFWFAFWSYLIGAALAALILQRPPKNLPEREITEAATRALSAFQAIYPNEKILNWALRSMTPTQYVISVRYEKDGFLSLPPLRRYFVVGQDGVFEADARTYWPRGLK